MSTDDPEQPTVGTDRVPDAFGHVRARMDEMLSDTEEDVEDRWFWVLCVGLLIAVALVGFLRLLHLAQPWVGTVCAIALSVASVALLLWVYWRMQLDARDRTPFALALLSGLAVLCVSTEAFASLTASLWEAGHFSGTGSVPSLRAAEQYYIWHLLDAVPLLKIPASLSWEAPVAFHDHASGALLLAFRAFVILPMIGVVISVYRLIQSREEQRAKEHAEAFARDSVVVEFTRAEYISDLLSATRFQALIWSWRLISPLVAYGIILFVISRSSALKEWVAQRARDDVLGVHLAPSWVTTPIDFLAVLVVLALAVWAFVWTRIPITFAHTFDRGSATVTFTAVAVRLRLLVILTLASCAIALLLLHVGIAEITPAARPDQEVRATIGWYAWHLADTIPFLDAPTSLNWVLPFSFTDPWTGVLLVILKINLVTILVLPVGLLIRLYLHHASERHTRPDRAQLNPLARRYKI